MLVILPYLGLFGPISVCLAAIFWLCVIRFTSSQDDVILHERQVSRHHKAEVSRI